MLMDVSNSYGDNKRVSRIYKGTMGNGTSEILGILCLEGNTNKWESYMAFSCLYPKLGCYKSGLIRDPSGNTLYR